MKRRLAGLFTGLAVAAMPALAAAQDRALDATDDSGMVIFYTFLALAGLFLLSAIGYLYRRERHLDWDFQKPDEPHHDEDHH